MNIRAIKVFKKLFLNYLNYKLGRPWPLLCYYHITHRCNLSCRLCLNVQREKLYLSHSPANIFYKNTPFIKYLSLENEMITEQAKYAIDQLEKLGISIITFTGGEPLLRKDLEELAHYARKKGMRTHLFTNGTLMTDEKVKSLKGCFDSISVSIYGLGKLDDEIKQKEGNFQNVIKFLQLSKKYHGAIVGIRLVISRYNCHQIEDFLDFAKKYCDFAQFVPIELGPNEEFLNKETALIVEKKLLKLKEENKDFITNSMESLKLYREYLMGKIPLRKCIAYNLVLTLGPAGEFGACCYPFAIGNILTQDPKKLLKIGLSKKKEIQKKCRAMYCLTHPSLDDYFLIFSFFKKNFKKILDRQY